MGPLLVSAPLRVPVKRGASVLSLMRRFNCGIEELWNHGLVGEDWVRGILRETAPQVAFGINIKFVLSSSDVTPDSDTGLSYPSVEVGLGYEMLLLSPN